MKNNQENCHDRDSRKGRDIAAWLPLVFGGWLAVGLMGLANAETIYRCDNTYTNRLPSNAPDAARCVVVNTANVTVVEGTKVYTKDDSAKVAQSATEALPVNKVDASVQKNRDDQAQQILQTELTKAQSQQLDLQKQLDQLSAQTQQSRKDTQAQAKRLELQQALERTQADVNALQRELLRAGNAKGAK